MKKQTQQTKKIKNILLFLSLLFLTLYIPLSIMIYSNSYYQTNYNNLNTYNYINESLAKNTTNNLINYFTYKEQLNHLWALEEEIHMEDVRNIFSILFSLAILSSFLFSYNYNKEKLKQYSKINISIIISLILIFPFFNSFWDNIFHPILFNNSYWILTSNQISYYLFPYSFFQNSLIFLIVISLIENILIYLFAKN